MILQDDPNFADSTGRTRRDKLPSRTAGLFCLVCIIAWALLLAITIRAIAAMGLDAYSATFVADFAHPWRAQFYMDFSLHVLFAAAWIAWRSRAWVNGLVGALLAIFLGMLFVLPYLVIAILRARGEMRIVLLGWRA
jgi:hypothetical protein